MPEQSDRIRLAAATLALFGAVATIAAAWAFQIWGGYQPCKLCYEERIPYYVGIPVLFAAVIASATLSARAARLLLLLAGAVFLVGLGMGVYHAGVEWGWWLGPADCSATGVGLPTNANDILGQLGRVRVVSCVEARWRFLGLSFAGWNAVACAGIAGAAFVGALVRERRWRPATERA